MPLPTQRDLRPVDPVNTQLSIGFKNARYYWDVVAPPVSVDEKSGTYFIWTRDFWFRREAGALRAPTAQYQRIGFGVTTGTYDAPERGFEELVSEVIEASSQAPDDLETLTVQHLTEIMQIELEKIVSAGVFVTGVHGTSTTLSGVNQWSDYAGSDPIADSDLAKRTIRRNTGAEPNVLSIGALPWEVLKEHPLILDKYKHTQTGIMTEDLVAAALGMPRLNVMKSVENTAAENATYVGADMWTDNALWQVQTPTPGLRVPNNAYTIIWDEKGNFPWAMDSYPEENTRSMVHRIFTHPVFELTAAQYGYILLDTNA